MIIKYGETITLTWIRGYKNVLEFFMTRNFKNLTNIKRK